MVLLRLLGSFVRPYARQVALLVALLVAQTAGNLYLPNLNGDIINNGVVAGNLHYILHTGEWMLVLTLVIGLFSVGGIYWASRVAMRTGADIRTAVFSHVQKFSTRDMNVFGTASLITRNTNDVQQIQIFLQMALTMMVVAPIMCFGGIAMALHEGAQLSTLLLVAVPVMGVFLGTVMVKVVPKFRSMQVKIDRLNEVLREQITGVRVIRAFVRSDFEGQRFNGANQDLTGTALSVNRTFAMMLPMMMIILNLSSVAVVWFGGRLVSEGSMPIGNLTAFCCRS
jgi:ATP-binding cassette subfamily B protein